MTQIPVDVWHVNKELMGRLRANKSKEAKRLFRQLDNREFSSNALSYLFSISLALAVFGFFAGGGPIIPIIFIAIAILSKWGSDKLKDSATAILVDYFKQKQKTNRSNKDVNHKNSEK